jgi:hypothetical protein
VPRDRRARPPRDDRFGTRPPDERGQGRRDDGRGRRDERAPRGDRSWREQPAGGKRPDRRGAGDQPRPRSAPLETRRGQAEPSPEIPPGPDRPPRPGQEPQPVPARSEEIVIPPLPPERGQPVRGPEGTRLNKRRGGEPR